MAAAGDTREVSALSRAGAHVGADAADLAPAEEAGLVRIADGELDFTHPLVRSAVYADAGAAQRREAHAALAAALPDRDVDRRAWHLASATIGPNAAAASALEQAGARAAARNAYAVAAGAYERAARLAVAADARSRLLFAAAEAALSAGALDRTAALLDAAAVETCEARLTAHIDRVRGQLALRRGPVTDACPRLSEAAARVAHLDPELAVVMLGEAVHGGFWAGDTEAMVAAARRASELAARTDSARASFFAAMAAAMALTASGEGEPGSRAARRAVDILLESAELRDDPTMLGWAGMAPLWLREEGVGRDLIDRAFARARSEGALGTLPLMLQLFARDQATSDRWADASASFHEAIRLATESGQRCQVAAAMAGLACLHAREGREEACRRTAEGTLALCAELGIGTYAVWAVQALGDLELGLGRPAASVVHHRAQADELRRLGIADVNLSPAPELTDAYLRLGRPDDAAAAAEPFAAAAERKGQPWARARAARCRGLLPHGNWERAFEEALALHARTPDVFETARTWLAYGGRLRRARQRTRAREQLRAALETFDRLGARPWAEQARTELAATGERARRRDASTRDGLTPQEFQIARLLADGMTTREAAASVFLSPKTVEHHLRSAYQKLGVHSRAALAAALDSADAG